MADDKFLLNSSGFIDVDEEDDQGSASAGLWITVRAALGGYTQDDVMRNFKVSETQVRTFISRGEVREIQFLDKINGVPTTNYPSLRQYVVDFTTPIGIPEDPGSTNQALPLYGTITNLSGSFAGDELNVSVSVYNNSQITQEYRAYMYDFNGDKIDKEPDTFWKNVTAGSTQQFNLTTNLKYSDIQSVMSTGGYRVVIFAQGFVYVDSRIVTNEGNIYTEDQFNSGEVVDPDSQYAVTDPEPPPEAPPFTGDTGGWGDWGTGIGIGAIALIALVAILLLKK